MKLFAVFSILVVLLITVPVRAQAQQGPDDVDFSAHDLYTMCTSSYDTDYGYCAGYVTAIANTLTKEPVSGYRACHLTPVRSQQLIDIFKNYMDTHQEKMGHRAYVAVADAFASAFPCEN